MDCIVHGSSESDMTEWLSLSFTLHHLSLSSSSTPVTALFSALGHGLPCSIFWGSLQGFPYSFQDSIWVLGELRVLLVSWCPTKVSLGFGPCPKHVRRCGMDSWSLGSCQAETQLFLDVLWASGRLLLQMSEGFAVPSGHVVSALGAPYSNSRLYLGHGFSQSCHIPMHLGRPGMLFCFLHTQPDGARTCEAVLWSLALALPLVMAPPVHMYWSACPEETKGLLRIYSLFRTRLSNFVKNRHGLAQCWTTYFWIVT